MNVGLSISSASINERDWRREFVSLQIRDMIRREERMRYFVAIGGLVLALTILILTMKIATISGFMVLPFGRAADVTTIVATVVAGLAALVSGWSWWSARSAFVRTEIDLLRLDIERLDWEAEEQLSS
jgi:hypothetical protein